jgi:hypothetical protein
VSNSSKPLLLHGICPNHTARSRRLFVKTKVEQKAIALRTGDLDLASLLQRHTDSLM